ncbi:signal peptide peptidase SppA [Limibaculum sp. M0105]|uniref:Signal peptide peptidase SppA n=1 Tax=Thermohalobaculum xanthum TaxID=2753746 RepID=A0A8J7MA25_9RHOB|nr:signal peptide peptidase SppA [Thermohalobaculum xanthum]MBK0400473.1 signal peptide peptidase SppA [Thermohalobaculum xanthum]
MTATSDLIIERRRMRRRLAFWRILAIVALAAVAIVLIPRPSGGVRGDHVARVSIDGIITDDRDRDASLAKLAKDDNVRALLVRINSPGGTVAGSEALYQSLRAVAAEKPVVAVMAEAAASGGYVTAIAADHIVARATTLTGSIGVVAEAPNFTGLLDTLGISVMRTKSAPLKAEPSILTEPAPGAIAAQQSLIDDSFVWFRDLVAERRKLSGAELAAVTDGRAFTGRQALDLGLIDAIGGEEVARAWLDSEHGVPESMKISDWTWDEPKFPWPVAGIEDRLFGRSQIDLLLGVGPRLFAVIQ